MSEHLDVIRAIEGTVADNLKLLVPLDKAWQPSDYLPDLESANWQGEVERFRQVWDYVDSGCEDKLDLVLILRFLNI